jgi:capsular polysaccharide biosynthesis protein/Mrp family chromosome partitioning ATPase
MEFRFISTAIRRRRFLIALFVVVGIVLGGVWAVRSTRQYRALASVIVDPASSAPPGSQVQENPDRFVAGQIDILGSEQLAAQVASQIKGETTQSVLSSVTASERGVSDVIDIVATSTSPQRAADLANGVANAYLAQHANTTKALQDQSNQIAGQLSSLQQQLGVVDSGLSADPKSGTDLAAQQLLTAQYNQLLQSKAQVDLAVQEQSAAIRLFDPARAPASAQPRHLIVKVAAGAAIGLLLGIGIAILDAAFRPRLASRDDVEELLGCPVRAELPVDTRVRDGRGAVTLDGGEHAYLSLYPGSHFAEELRKACVFAEAAPTARRTRSVLVTSSSPSAGRSTVIHGMAAVMAQSGLVVTLVEVNRSPAKLDQPALVRPRTSVRAARDDLPEPAGPAELDTPTLVDWEAGLGSALQFTPSGSAQFTVLPVAKALPWDGVNVAQWLDRLDRDDDSADVVLIDAGPLNDRSAAVAFAQAVDAIVLVVPVPYERRDTLDSTIRSGLSTSRATLVPVMNRPPRPSSRRLHSAKG